MSDKISATSEPTVGLRKLLVRGWPALVLGIVAGLIGGMLLQRAQTPQYKSTAEVLVTHTGVETSSPSTNARTTGVVNLDTESNLGEGRRPW